MQNVVDQLLVLGLADPLDEAVRRELLAQLVRREAVFGEAKVEEGRDGHPTGGFSDLFLLFGKVGAADEAYGALLAEGGEDRENLGGGVLSGGFW